MPLSDSCLRRVQRHRRARRSLARRRPTVSIGAPNLPSSPRPSRQLTTRLLQSPNLPPGAPTSAAGLLTTAVGSAATGSPAPAAPSVVPPSPSAVGGAVPINSASSEGTGHTRPVPRPAASAQASGGASAGWTGPTQTASSTDAVVKASSTATWFSAGAPRSSRHASRECAG